MPASIEARVHPSGCAAAGDVSHMPFGRVGGQRGLAMPKNKRHKGLLKRVRVSKTGKVRHRSAFHKHLSSHKSGKRLRQLRKDRCASNPEAKRFEKLLFRRLRGRTQPRSARQPSPSPEQRAEMRAQQAAEPAAQS